MLQVLNVDMVDRGLCFTATNIDCSLDMELQQDTTTVEPDQVTSFSFDTFVDKHQTTFEELDSAHYSSSSLLRNLRYLRTRTRFAI